MKVVPRRAIVPLMMILLASVLFIPVHAAPQNIKPTLVPTHVVAGEQSETQGSTSTPASYVASFQRRPPITINYDEQLGLTFTQDFTSLEYNVTAVEQVDPTLDTGPGYLLSGLSNTAYWYQVGLSYNWSPGDIPGTGFAMSYEVFNPIGNSVFPANGGGGLLSFSGTVNAGDNVTLNLYFSSTGQVVMIADDLETGAAAEVTYPSFGGTAFVGQPDGDATSLGFFTGLMTEWYHGEPYYTNPAEVIYSTNAPISSAWFWMDEFNANNGQLVFASNATAVSTFTTSPAQLQEYSYQGITMYGDAFEFVTGGSTGSTTTSSSTPTSASTVTVATTETITVTQTASVGPTITITTTVTRPVTTTSTQGASTVTVTTTSTPAPSTTTATQTTTQVQTVTAHGVLASWSYWLMAVSLLVGLGAGFLLTRPVTKQV